MRIVAHLTRMCERKIGWAISHVRLNALHRYGAAEYVPESGDPADLDLRARYEAHEKKAEHDRLLKQLQLRYPGLILLRHRTVEALLLAGANPTQKVNRFSFTRAGAWQNAAHIAAPFLPPTFCLNLGPFFERQEEKE